MHVRERAITEIFQGVHPVLAASDVTASVQFYARLGFTLVFQDQEFVGSGMIGAATGKGSPWAARGDTPWGTREFHLRDPGQNGLQFYCVL